MNRTQVRVRRDRPTALAWAVALAVTMLAVYVLTLNASLPDAAKSASAAPRVTREVTLEALSGWCVSLGAWPTRDRARVECAACAERGAAGYLYKADGQWHVLGALYGSGREAERTAQRLRDKAGIDAAILPLSAGQVKLRVTAPQAQVDLIVDAAALLRTQVDRLSDAARQLDRGTLQPEAARTLCALAATEAGALRERLAAIPGAAVNALCAALIDALSSLSTHLETISGSVQASSPALSSLLHAACIDDFLRLKALQESAGR